MGGRKRRKVFDKDYYHRFYRDPETSVATEAGTRRLGRFVSAYLDHLCVDVEHVLDLGCGLGAWRDVIAKHYPDASYTGVEISDYLCRTHGWKKGSAADFRSRRRYDLVICQGVLQYLDDREARAAIENLDRLCGGVLFLEVLTREDWEHNCDQDVTDSECYLREATWYATRLGKYFTNCGGGVRLSRRVESYIYELDKCRAG